MPLAASTAARSVEHNLEEALRNLTKLSSQERKQRILELMDLTATNRKLLDTPTKNLSGGEQRRVALLRALAVRPDYLILDELTSGLDLISQKAIREVLEAYHRGIPMQLFPYYSRYEIRLSPVPAHL